MRKVRFFFSKLGRAKYISHLDMIRCVNRSIRRGGLPVKMTGGFSPRIYLTFALPLSLGIEGERETMDTEIPDELDYAEAMRLLNSGLPDDIRIVEAAEPIYDHRKIESAEYEIITDCDGERLNAFISRDKIITPKRSKKGVFDIDLKPLILGWREENGKYCVTLPAGVDLNINPTLIFEAFEREFEVKIHKLYIKRTRIFCKNGDIFK